MRQQLLIPRAVKGAVSEFLRSLSLKWDEVEVYSAHKGAVWRIEWAQNGGLLAEAHPLPSNPERWEVI